MEKKIIMTTKEVAAYLKISVDGVYAMVHEHKIPCLRVNRRLRFDLAVINAWLEQNQQQPLQ